MINNYFHYIDYLKKESLLKILLRHNLALNGSANQSLDFHYQKSALFNFNISVKSFISLCRIIKSLSSLFSSDGG